MKNKKNIISLTLLTSISVLFSTSFAQNAISENGGTTYSHTSINQQQLTTKEEKANFWGLDDEEWDKYERYMELEGRFYYQNLSPLNVMALIENDQDQRNVYIAKHVVRERARVKNQVQLTHDAWKIQKAMYGAENIVDFSSVPWGSGFDERTIILPNVTEEDLKAPAYVDKTSEEFLPDDEIIMVLDPTECVGSGDSCKRKLQHMLKNQPLSIVILALKSDEKTFNKFAEVISLNEAIATDKVKVELFESDPFYFEKAPEANQVYLLRSGMVIKEL